MRKFLLTVFFLCFFCGMLEAQSGNLFDKLIFSNEKGSLPYRFLKPVNPNALERFPLIIFLHGAGERGNDNEAQIKHIQDLVLDPKYRGKYACYVLAPQCAKGEWWTSIKKDKTFASEPTEPMGLTIELIEKIIRDFPIDEARIYVTGVSMGGYGTWELISRFPNKFAAAIPVCGGGDSKVAESIKHIPIWAFHGSLDTVVVPNESRRMIQAIQRAGGRPGYTEYPDVQHASWVQAYQEPHLLPWLFKQRNSAQASK